MKRELVEQFQKAMEAIGSLIDWSEADIVIWIKFQTDIIKLINNVSADTSEQAIKDGRKLILELEANLNCNVCVCNLVWQTLDAITCKYMSMYHTHVWR